MRRLVQMLIKRKFLVLIIFILMIVLIFLLVLLPKEEESKKPIVKMNRIESPYPIQEKEVSIDMGNQKINYPKTGRVYGVESFSVREITSFLIDYYTTQQEFNYENDFFLEFKEGFFFWNASTGIFSLSSPRGIVTDLKVIDEDSLKIFLQEYFNIEDVRVSGNSPTQRGREYKGSYILENMFIGTTFLSGDAFYIEVGEDARILNFSIFLLDSDKVVRYQDMPLVDIQTLIANKKYPKMVRHLESEERFNINPPSFDLSEFFVNNLELLYLFNDLENGYAMPTYKLQGEGRLVNDRDDRVWSKTDIYICAIDPSYLTERPQDLKESLRDEPSPGLPI